MAVNGRIQTPPVHHHARSLIGFMTVSVAALAGLTVGVIAVVHDRHAERGAALPTASIAVEMTDSAVVPRRTLVTEGLVDFVVTNGGSQPHPFTVLRTDATISQLVLADDGRVDEEAEGVKNVLQSDDIPPGESATLHAALVEGNYVVLSNGPGSFAAGMRTLFIVAHSNAAATALNTHTADFAVTSDLPTVPAGLVDLDVANAGPLPHELILFKTDFANDKLPLDQDGRVIEDADGIVNAFDTGDSIDAGATKHFDIALTAGNYVMLCNLPAHYGKGMHIPFKVTDPVPST
jgi:uncharacterized cupredoxin-like copper-binding protein